MDQPEMKLVNTRSLHGRLLKVVRLRLPGRALALYPVPVAAESRRRENAIF